MIIDGDAFCQVCARLLLVACSFLCQVSMIVDGVAFCQVHMWMLVVACGALYQESMFIDGGHVVPSVRYESLLMVAYIWLF